VVLAITIVPSLRTEMASFVDEALEERGLRRRVVATTTRFVAIPMMLKQAPVIATLQARIAHYCANAASLATSPLPFPSPTLTVSMVWHRRGAGFARRVT
jgi:LysR family transcriptional activator of mexEF-oprN operon